MDQAGGDAINLQKKKKKKKRRGLICSFFSQEVRKKCSKLAQFKPLLQILILYSKPYKVSVVYCARANLLGSLPLF